MKIVAARELMTIVFEFLLSIVVLVGGGYLLTTGSNTEIASSMITAVITFWFVRRQNEANQKASKKDDTE
ncbi:hypothetical protein D3C73_1546070 [compost metagenome]